MKFLETDIVGVFLIEPDPVVDERGWFARIRCEEEFAARGLDARFVQTSLSRTERRGTLRGMHFQIPPKEEVKLVRCQLGSIFDVALDLRPDSATHLHHFSVELSADNYRMLYVPRGCAHGFQTLESPSEVVYEISEYYSPDHGRGVRWNDPAFGIPWPIQDPILHPRDRGYPDYHPGVVG